MLATYRTVHALGLIKVFNLFFFIPESQTRPLHIGLTLDPGFPSNAIDRKEASDVTAVPLSCVLAAAFPFHPFTHAHLFSVFLKSAETTCLFWTHLTNLFAFGDYFFLYFSALFR